MRSKILFLSFAIFFQVSDLMFKIKQSPLKIMAHLLYFLIFYLEICRILGMRLDHYLMIAILTDFKNATLTSLYSFQNTVVCKIPLIS